jgi:hypothetical protein
MNNIQHVQMFKKLHVSVRIYYIFFIYAEF